MEIGTAKKPKEAIAKLRDFTPCLDRHLALVDRDALEEVLAYLTSHIREH